MSIDITFNAVSYEIPEFRDTNYANELTQFFVAIPNGVLQPTGGLFTLLADVDFGASYGLKSLYYKSRATFPAAAGSVRLGNTESVSWRNATNGGDKALTTSASDLLQFAGANVFVFGTSLIADGDLSTGINATHLANGSVSNTEFQYLDGVTSAIQTQLDAKLNLSGGTLSGALGIGGAADASSLLTITSTTKGFLPSRMTTTQRDAIVAPATGLLIYNITTNQYNSYDSAAWVALAMSSGGTVNAGIQYQLGYYATNGTSISGLTLTASKALASDANGVPVASTTTGTELGYVAGVTSALQTQLNLKAPLASPTFSGTITTPLTASRAVVTGASSELAVSATTAAEIAFVSGVSSAIQTQLNTKATDSLVVHLAGTESITGAKTFSALLSASNAIFLAASSAPTYSSASYLWAESGVGTNYDGFSHKFNIGAVSRTQGMDVLSSGSLQVYLATNQLILGGISSGRTVTITAPQPASSSRVHTIPDVSADASFVMTAGTQTIAGTKTFSGQLIGKGTATNDSAAAGYIGEYIESLVSSNTSVGTSGQYFDATSITLTAGDWDVTGLLTIKSNSATFTSTYFAIGISTTTGNSATGLVEGVNDFDYGAVVPTTFSNFGMSVPTYRMSVAGSTVVYLKGFVQVYTVGTPKYTCRLSAWRRR